MSKENYRILIPTNRSVFLSQICKFYKEQDLKVTIVHNFILKKKLKKNKKIKFLYLKNSVANRLVFALKNIKEKYVCIIGDDDFIFKDSIIKSVEFLDKNKNYSDAQGLHHRFEVYGKKTKLFPCHIKAMMGFKSDFQTPLGRVFQSFTYKFIDKFYSVMRTKDLYKITKSSIPLENYSRVSVEYYWIVCCALMGKGKILNNLHCFRREHKKNDTKLSKEKGLDASLEDPEFRKIFYNCIKKFQKIKKIKKIISKNQLFFILNIFKLKIRLKGKFITIRKLFELIRFLREKKLEPNYKTLFQREVDKYNKIKKIVL